MKRAPVPDRTAAFLCLKFRTKPIYAGRARNTIPFGKITPPDFVQVLSFPAPISNRENFKNLRRRPSMAAQSIAVHALNNPFLFSDYEIRMLGVRSWIVHRLKQVPLSLRMLGQGVYCQNSFWSKTVSEHALAQQPLLAPSCTSGLIKTLCCHCNIEYESLQLSICHSDV